METSNYNNEVLATEEITQQKKICKCCGKELPLTAFHKQSKGYRNTCIACLRNNKGVSEKFKNFTSRELMEELRARGFNGKLKYYRVEEYEL